MPSVILSFLSEESRPFASSFAPLRTSAQGDILCQILRSFYSLRMTIITGFSVSLLCFVFSGMVFSAVSLAAETKRPDARRIFNNNCAKCHGKFGKPTKRGRSLGSPNFSSRFWQVAVTDEQIVEAITYGRNKMPGWRKELTPEEIKAAARWVRVLGKKRR